MVLTSYKVQAEHLFRDYILADIRIMYTSIVHGICASKTHRPRGHVMARFIFDKLKNFFQFRFMISVKFLVKVILRATRALQNPKKSSGTIVPYQRFMLCSSQRCQSTSSFCQICTLAVLLRALFMINGASVGYFLSDIAMIFWFYPSLGGMEYVIHHLLATVSLMYAILTGEGQFYTFMVLISETTTPSVNLRWYLENAGMKNSRSYIGNGVVMFVSLFLSFMSNGEAGVSMDNPVETSSFPLYIFVNRSSCCVFADTNIYVPSKSNAYLLRFAASSFLTHKTQPKRGQKRATHVTASSTLIKFASLVVRFLRPFWSSGFSDVLVVAIGIPIKVCPFVFFC